MVMGGPTIILRRRIKRMSISFSSFGIVSKVFKRGGTKWDWVRIRLPRACSRPLLEKQELT